MFNSPFSNILTKNHPPTKHLILNKNINENDDVDDDDSNFSEEKNREEIKVPEFGG